MRAIFLFANFSAFQPISVSPLFSSFFYGFRLDIIPTTYVTCGVFLLTFFFKKPRIRILLLSVFGITTALLGIIDALYFSILKNHLSADIFWQLKGDNNISPMVYIQDYWPFFILFVAISVTFVLILRRINQVTNATQKFWHLAIFILCFFGLARGFQKKPYRSANVGQYLAEPYLSLAMNTPLYLLETYQNPINIPDFAKGIAPKYDFSQTLIDTLPINYNYVIIILESFGKEYTAFNHNWITSYTPNLDKLMDSSVCFTNAYANGLKSMDAVPAIFCGIPRLSNSPFINSPLSAKPANSILQELKKQGYTSLFFHGADNNSMGFQTFLTTNGLDFYFGKDEYDGGKSGIDGFWGIYDHAMFDFAQRQISVQKEPFIAGIFTLTSHHPYPIPDQFKNTFPKGNLDIHESIGYTDFALRSFLDSCKKQPWFDRTIFIITADHSAENTVHAFRTFSGKYEIPMLIYAPKILTPKVIDQTVSQIDIFPTVLSMNNRSVGYNLLGNDMLSMSERPVCHYDNQLYSITLGNWNLLMNDAKPLFLYDRKNDPNCVVNLLNEYPEKAKELEEMLKQKVANYHHYIKPNALQ
ncbi:MAG: sulfatase-like hydrolase/transferase [Flavobacteriales bacterium]|nr:sulfatase-like hydrolase/transferase [Flavobacteriales bacterium]